MHAALVGSPRKTNTRGRPARGPHTETHAPCPRDEMKVRARPRASSRQDTRCNRSHHEVVRISLEIFYDIPVASCYVAWACTHARVPFVRKTRACVHAH